MTKSQTIFRDYFIHILPVLLAKRRRERFHKIYNRDLSLFIYTMMERYTAIITISSVVLYVVIPELVVCVQCERFVSA